MIVQIILAAGMSTRMGRPKPLLDFGGTPLLARIVGEAKRSRVDSVVVVLGHEADAVRDAVDLEGVRVIVNDAFRSGQTSSLQAALRALPAETEAFLNLPVDYPGVTHREIDAVLSAYRTAASTRLASDARTTIVTAAHGGRRGRPTLFAREHVDEILALGTDEPVRDLLERHSGQVSEIEVDSPHVLRDMDTPESYRQWLRVLGFANEARESDA